MKKSTSIQLVLLTGAGLAALNSCGHRECVDEHGYVVDDKNCDTGSHGYYWHPIGGFAHDPLGYNVQAVSGTEQGVFGAAGDAAHAGGGGEGAGE